MSGEPNDPRPASGRRGPRLRGVRFDRTGRRKLFSHAITILAGLSVVVVLIPLVSVVYTAATRGGALLFNPAFYSSNLPLACTALSCQTVGIWPAIQGTLILMGLAGAISCSVGILAAIFASEYRTRGLGRAISFTADVLAGVPSILMGLFVYSYLIIYNPLHAYSAFAGVLALSALMIPIVLRTTEEALRTVPNSLREAALALGVPKWKTTVRIVLVTALPGVLTGVLLAMMRAAGEAAPLLLTAGSSFVPYRGINYQVETLPILIYNFAESPSSNWLQVAWGATLFLIIFVLAANVLSRYSIARMVRRMEGR